MEIPDSRCPLTLPRPRQENPAHPPGTHQLQRRGLPCCCSVFDCVAKRNAFRLDASTTWSKVFRRILRSTTSCVVFCSSPTAIFTAAGWISTNAGRSFRQGLNFEGAVDPRTFWRNGVQVSCWWWLRKATNEQMNRCCGLPTFCANARFAQPGTQRGILLFSKAIIAMHQVVERHMLFCSPAGTNAHEFALSWLWCRVTASGGPPLNPRLSPPC